MSNSPRARKMADLIRRIVAERLQRGLGDPRMGYVTVTDVRVSGDLHNASVYYTVLGNQTERQDTQSALAAATGMLRSEVGRNITAKLTPSLEFIMDGVPENAIVIENLLQEARKRDAEVGRQKTSARYAGDEQPYKVPQTNDEN